MNSAFKNKSEGFLELFSRKRTKCADIISNTSHTVLSVIQTSNLQIVQSDRYGSVFHKISKIFVVTSKMPKDAIKMENK